MKVWSVSRFLALSFSLVLTFGLCGCATPRIDWNSRIGRVTYDDIVVDMGPPDKQAELKDGTLVAEWLTRRSYHTTYVSGYYGAGCYPYHYYGPVFPAYTDYYSPDYFLRLVFDPDRKLQSWKELRR